MTVDGELLDRSEVFDEEDLDTALAKFDELSRPAPRLENAASRVYERFLACFGARDWNAGAEMLADGDSQRRPPSSYQRGGSTRSRRHHREHAGNR